MTHDLPAVRFALPFSSENRWSDMLAVLIDTDPYPICRLLELDADPGEIHVRREVAVNADNRPDLILHAGGRPVAVIEVKVLAGLGRKQLDRYADAEPGAQSYVIVFPERLPVDTQGSHRWRRVTWEQLIDAYRASTHPWVNSCATAWRHHLDSSLPKVDRTTVWNDLADGEDFVLAIRARMSWIYSTLQPPQPINHDLVGSSAGASWVVRMYTDARALGYVVMAEVEERLGVRAIPKLASSATRPPLGPSIKVVLLQHGVTTSAGFDWDYLLAMWPLMSMARSDWVQTSARPKKHDKDNYMAMVAKGGPRHLGIGFGEAQTRIKGECMFGARIQLAPTINLGELAATLEDLYQLVLDMAQLKAPNTTPIQPSIAQSLELPDRFPEESSP